MSSVIKNSYANLTVKAEMDGSRSYYHHDSSRRVEFSASRGGHRGRHQRRGDGHSHGAPFPADDEDVTMSNAGGNESRGPPNRFNPYTRRGGRGGNNQGRGKNRPGGGKPGRGNENGGTWSRVVIPFGKRTPKNVLLEELARVCPVPFTPINYGYDGSAAVFYVEDRDTAAALAGISKLGETPNGVKIVVLIRAAQDLPVSTLTPESIKILEQCVSHRCSAAHRSVNLADFQLDAGVRAAGYVFYLERVNVMTKVMDKIQNNTDNVLSLDLSGNNLRNLDGFAGLEIFKTLTCLLLDRNLISRLSDLEKIKRLPLQELSLAGNPVVQNYRDHADYVDAVRRIFPNLVKLDGVVLPPEIGFAIEQAVALPQTEASFFVSEESRAVVVQFITQFYNLFDAGDRAGLIDAYHSEAMFSTSCHRNGGAKSSNLTHHILDSRNLLRIHENERRNRLLHIGKSNIISFFERFPKTLHDPASFTVDLALATPAIITFSLCGIFKEIANKSQNYPVRSFSRSFVLVPLGAGYCIINETLVVSNPTDEQIRNAFKTPAPTPRSSPIVTHASPAVLVKTEHQQMIATFCQHSRMNVDWATKCLQDNEWDFAKAAAVFAELNAQGHIPPQAFVSA